MGIKRAIADLVESLTGTKIVMPRQVALVFEQEHLKRFLESAKTAGVRVPSQDKLNRELERALENFPPSPLSSPPFSGRGKGEGRDTNDENDVFVRLSAWRDQVFVMIGQRKHPEAIYQTGVALKTSPVRRTLSNAAPAAIKTTAYHNAFLASLEPAGTEIYESVFLDANGLVTEVRIGNLFIVKEKKLFTPPEPGILNGVTRKFVIECALHEKIQVKEVFLSRHDIYNAEEAFLTNTSWEILPIRELDSRAIGVKIPGPMTTRLQRIFKQKVKKECP